MLLGATIVTATLVALLAIPIALQFDLSWHGKLTQRCDVIWAFGLVRGTLTPPAARASADGRSGRARRVPSAAPRNKRAGVLRALRFRPFRRRIMRFVGELWHAIGKQDVRLAVRVGLGDPADTGRLWALLGPCAGLLGRVPDIAVAVEPEFQDATLEVDSSGVLRLVPLRVVAIVVALAASPSFWQGIRIMRR